ncbi:type I restriction-modification system DNA methylase subunit [Paenibacillus sp. LBL]|uniref:N-6 DNA methylase n=1 Tax=Paenibacillus TaxID=44249 RepID=UPI00096D97F9|nr:MULTISPECIES: N-6 DNA methylase [Paenibacillus]MDH6671245.1 type I restriction-modification system DNA methylase subunit [Paenibacillus sp. LBL]OMF72035.1 hypothetical protein BK142_21355 [Paenibacillus glucanolyticus]
MTIDYSKYYTPKLLAELLVSECGLINPDSIVDICAGSWNLLNAARAKWPTASITGVDIDSRSINSIIMEGRLFSIDQVVSGRKYDLVLANPPFKYESPHPTVVDALRTLTEDYQFPGYTINRLESTMMICNSLLVKDEGYLAAIVPIGLINSLTQWPLRKYLCQGFTLKKIIYLPDKSFGSEALATAIVILQKKELDNIETNIYKAYMEADTYNLEWIEARSTELIKEGLWAGDYIPKGNGHSLHNKIIRNSVSSGTFRESGKPVLHSTSICFGVINHSGIKYTHRIPNYPKFTQKNDIILTRVGRKCGDFATITEREEGYLTSDCVFIIRPKDSSALEQIIYILKKTDFTKQRKGLAAKYITKSDLEDIINYSK